MTTASLVTELAVDYLRSEGIFTNATEIYPITIKWINRLRLYDIDFISLAAVVIANPFDRNQLTAEEISKLRDFYFPSYFSLKED